MSLDFPNVDIMGMSVACVDQSQLLDAIFGDLRRGRGLWVVTANLDFLRRHAQDSSMAELYARADIRVADGMPLVWASRLQGTPLPQRIAGSSLIWPLAERAAAENRSLYLLGGTEDSIGGTIRALREEYPSIRIAGCSSPSISPNPSSAEIDRIRAELRDAAPDILLVGLGSPKQERVIAALRSSLPSTCMIGVGISFSFVAGLLSRAPDVVQSAGLEWVHRLAQEPRRLTERYLVCGIPFVTRLLVHSIKRRCRALIL